MARKPNIKYLMKQKLGQMAAFGQSKRADQERTWSERATLRSRGEYEAAKGIDYTKDKVYSYGTMELYARHTDYFGRWLCDNGMKNCTMDEAHSQIQPYIDSLVERGQSAWTVHTAAASICKVFGDRMDSYDLPKRGLADITKSRTEAIHDGFNSRHYGNLLQANEVLGLKKSELRDIRTSNFEVIKGAGSLGDAGVTLSNCDKIIVRYKGKGGKLNEKIYSAPHQVAAVQGLLQGKQSGERLFDKSQFRADCGDLHNSRSLAIKDTYYSVLNDIQNRPGAREEYVAAIRSAFSAAGKTMRENLDRPYNLRGEHRAYCEQRGIPTSFCRVSALYTSIQASHFRTDVTVGHYIAK